MNKPTIPSFLSEWGDRFKAYHGDNITWGSLHIVLDDGNLETSSVSFCMEWAEKEGDREGKALAEALLTLSPTQRRKLYRTRALHYECP